MDFSCYNCNCKDYVVVADKNSIRFNCFDKDKFILKCKQCELVQLYPQWTDEEINILYQKYSQKKDFPNQKRKKEIRKWIKKYFCDKNITILEVGCGMGDTVKWLRHKKYNACGIDRDLTVWDYKNGIYCWDFMNYCFNKSFIFCFQVLEHIRNPKLFIKHTLDLLFSKESRFVFEIPNVEDPILTIYKNKSYNKFYWYPYHLFFYSPKTILNILKYFPIKIKIIRKQRYGLINHMRWLLKGKPGNLNFHIPIFDDIYKFFLTKILKKSDTMVIVGIKL